MIAIPSELQVQFEERLLEKAIPKKTHWFYTKWLRYYLDFCRKYDFPDAKKESLAPFLRKLDEKKQTRVQQQQAAAAVALYFDLIEGKYPPAKLPPHPKTTPKGYATFEDTRQFSVNIQYVNFPSKPGIINRSGSGLHSSLSIKSNNQPIGVRSSFFTLH